MSKTKLRLNSILVISAFLLILFSTNCYGKCPENTEFVHRLGKSRFYLLQDSGKANGENFANSAKKCKELGLKLAKVDSPSDEVHLGRLVDKFLSEKKWNNTNYWMDAKFDVAQEAYIWQDNKQPLKFMNIFYRADRPKGYGDFYSKEKYFIHDPAKRDPVCLTYTLPFPYRTNYGSAASWWEMMCHETYGNNIMCESTDSHCEEEQYKTSASAFIEKTGVYYQGLWPMSERRYVVSWEPKTFADAKKFCEKNGMQLYAPSNDDKCLIPVLKNWMRRLTTYNFWTSAIFDVKSRTFTYLNGTEIPGGYQNRTWKSNPALKKRETLSEEIISKQHCASMFWMNEITPTNINYCKCDFSGMVLAPENCNSPMGVICQPKQLEKYGCSMKYVTLRPLEPGNYTSADNHVKFTEFYNFNGMDAYKRSAFKQPGNAGICPSGYKRVPENENYWGTPEDYEKSEFKYDFTEKYWMKPKLVGGHHKCKISYVTYDAGAKKLTRHFKADFNENCNRWLGFVLCKLIKGKEKRSIEEDELEFIEPF